jgi:AcrR family transcriptional regulator
MEEKKPLDRRVRKTRAQLKAGLIRLMQKKSIKEITVQELVDEVDINRSTFYLHYTDIQDMLSHLEEEFFESFHAILEEYDAFAVQAKSVDELRKASFLKNMYRNLKENGELCKVLFSANGDIQFINDVIETIGREFEERSRYVTDVHQNSRSEFVYEYCLYGCLGLIKRWMEDDFRESADTMADMTEELLIANMRALEDRQFVLAKNGQETGS